MSAHSIITAAPIGCVIAWSDGTPRPPARFKKKLWAWKSRNSSGRLIRKQGETQVGNIRLAANFTLHEADFGAGGIIAIRVHRTFSRESELRFTIVERPEVGSVRIFDRAGPDGELLHLAQHRAAAEEWSSRHRHPNAVLEDVAIEDTVAAPVAGRAA